MTDRTRENAKHAARRARRVAAGLPYTLPMTDEQRAAKRLKDAARREVMREELARRERVRYHERAERKAAARWAELQGERRAAALA